MIRLGHINLNTHQRATPLNQRVIMANRCQASIDSPINQVVSINIQPRVGRSVVNTSGNTVGPKKWINHKEGQSSQYNPNFGISVAKLIMHKASKAKGTVQVGNLYFFIGG